MKNAKARALLVSRFRFFLLSLMAVALFLFTVSFAGLLVLKNNLAWLEVALEGLGSRLLQRELQIGEVVEADLSWDTYILVKKVTLANPEWAQDPNFASAERILVRINIPSLWRSGPVLISQLELTGASINLRSGGERPANWDFWPDRASPEKTDRQDSASGKHAKADIPLRILDGYVVNSLLTYQDSNQDIKLKIEELKLREPDESQMVELELSAVVNDLPLTTKGRLGPTTALLSRQNLSMDLALALGKLSLKAQGTIQNLETLAGTNLHLAISTPQSRPVLELLGIPELGEGALHFQGHLTDAHPGLAVEVKGTLNEFDVQLSGTIADPRKFDGVKLNYQFDGPSVGDIGKLFGLDNLPDDPYDARGDFYRNDTGLGIHRGEFRVGEGRLQVSGRLPQFPEIDDWELSMEGQGFNLALVGGLLGIKNLPPVPHNVSVTLGSTVEGVELLNVEIYNANTKLMVSGRLGEGPEYLGSRVNLEFTGDELRTLGPWLGLETLPDSTFSLLGELSSDVRGWQLSDATFLSGGLQLSLNASVDSLFEPNILSGRLTLKASDLAGLGQDYGLAYKGLPAAPVAVHASFSGTAEAFNIDDMVLESGMSQLQVSGTLGDLRSRESVDLFLEFISADALKLSPGGGDAASSPLPVSARGHLLLSPDGIGVEDIEGTVGGAEITLKGLFNVTPPFHNSHFSLSTYGPDLAAVLNPWFEREFYPVPFQLSMDVRFQSGGVELKKIEARVADAQLHANIAMQDFTNPASAEGSLKIAGPSSLQLARFFGYEPSVPDAEYSLEVGIAKSKDWLELSPITLLWGRGDLSGRVAYRRGKPNTINIDLHSKFVSVPFLLPDEEEMAKKEAELAKAKAEKSAADPVASLTQKELAVRVISDTPLDFSWLKRNQGSLKYQVDEIYLSEEASSTAIMDVTISNGVLASRELHWDGDFLKGDVDLTLRALDKGASLDVYTDLSRLPVLLMMGGEPKYRANAFYRSRLTTSGDSWRAMAENANGALVFRAGGGRVDSKDINLLVGDLVREMLNRINPFRESEQYTKVICNAGAISIVNGKASFVPGAVLRSKKVDLILEGSVDLNSEKLDLIFNTRSRKGLGVSASKAITPYFKLGGTLANPRLVLDPKGMALSGSAAVATGGVSILAQGLWDRWVATAKNPCDRMLKIVAKEKDSRLVPLLQPAARKLSESGL